MSTVTKPATEVLVVGAGPVGLALACALARHRVACRIIDQSEGPTPIAESRALAIWERTQEVFADLECIRPVLDQAARIHGLNAYSDQRRIAHISLDLDGEDTEFPFVLSLPQGQTERILLDHLAKDGLQVECRTRLTDVRQDDREVTATLVGPDGRESTATAAWLVGCDGPRSTVRHRLGLSFQGAEYEEPFRLADVRLDWNLPDDEGHLFLLSEGAAMAAFPLPERGRWRLIDASRAEVGDEPAAILERFRQLLHSHGHPRVTVTDLGWASSFRIHRRMTDRLRVGRCFLAGDAAHIHSPVGGQGMNTGIQDAHNLAWKLALVLAGASPESLLDSYQAERLPVARGILRGTDLFTRMLTLRHRVAVGVRNALVSFLMEFGFVQRRLARAMSELNIDYRRSPVVAEDWGLFSGGPRPGERVPDVFLSQESADSPARLSEVLRGGQHTLLLFQGTSESAEGSPAATSAAELVRERYARWITLCLVTRPQGAAPGSLRADRCLIDQDGRLHDRFGAHSQCLYLIRPDGYIGYRARPPDANRLRMYLERIFV